MNVFLLDQDIKKSVQYYVDKHVVKIILEATQLLCNKHHLLLSELAEEGGLYRLYRLTHKHHPITRWVYESEGNYNWLCNFALELCKEYTYRFEKKHKCESLIKYLKDNPVIIFPRRFNMTPFILAMPSKYKNDDPIKSYRDYYNGEKRHLFKWTKRNIPEWINER